MIESREAMSSAGVPWATISTSVHAGARAHVDHVIGREDRLAIMLHDDHRIAEIPEPGLRLDEACIVPSVQAHARLVEYVENADERRSDLGRQPNALSFAR